MAAGISAALIVRDGAATLEACIASIRPHVDEVCILDTGSQDGTPGLVARLADEPGAPILLEQADWPGHYAQARNLNMAMCSHDWVLTIDADEILRVGESLQARIREAVRKGAGAVVLAGTLGIIRPGTAEALILGAGQLYQPSVGRLVDRRLGRWRGLVHEQWLTDAPFYYPQPTPRAVTFPYLHHARSTGVRLYEALCEEAASDPDAYEMPDAFLILALVRCAQHRYPEAVSLLERYLDEGWAERDGRFNEVRIDALSWLVILYRQGVWPRRPEQAYRCARELDAYLDEYAEAGPEVPPHWFDEPRRLVAQTLRGRLAPMSVTGEREPS